MVDFTHCNISCNGLRKEKNFARPFSRHRLAEGGFSRHSLAEGGL